MPHRCGHKSCECDTHGKDYCSTHCAEAARTGLERAGCDCGHPACRHRPR